MSGEFIRYHGMVKPLAAAALGRLDFGGACVRHQGGGPATLALVAPAAWVLIEGPTSRGCEHLPTCFRVMAELAEDALRRGQVVPALSDGRGHHREVYYPLAAHLLLRAYRNCYESLPVDAWGVCEELVPSVAGPLRLVEQWADTPPPSERVSTALWCALGLYDEGYLAARDADVELADAAAHQVVGPADLDAPLHPRQAEESLDAWTWRELTGLHALANLALARRHQAWAARVERIALYHQEHTQPDHVTAHPWGLFAFLWSPHTRATAEQQLHDVNTLLAGGASLEARDGSQSALAGLLLADAVDVLGAFGRVRQAS
jgi:hypothetical protein